jgi:chromosome segregation ATPase
MDLIAFMQEYCDMEREHASRMKSYTDRWGGRVKRQSTLVSYHTTKRAQLDVVRQPKELARLKETACQQMQLVINKFRHSVEQTYLPERMSTSRHHHQTSQFKKLFKSAHAELTKVEEELQSYYEQQKRMHESLRVTESLCELLRHDPSSTEKQRIRADEQQTKKSALLKEIDEQIPRIKEQYRVAKRTYRVKATDILRKCQHIEEGRLDQTREVLLDFIQAMHPTKYSAQLDEIFQQLTDKVLKGQNSFDDVVFWEQTHGIKNKLSKAYPTVVERSTSEDEPDQEERPCTDQIRRKKKSHGGNGDNVRVTHQERVPATYEPNDSEIDPSTPVSQTSSSKPTTKRSTKTNKTHHADTFKNISHSVLNQV